MFAVISHKGNQYKVEPGKEYSVDLLDLPEDQKEITFSDVLLVADGDKITVGEPTVKGAEVKAEVLGTKAGEKVRVYKFRAKKRYERTQGHRQKYTLIKVVQISHEK